MTLVASYSFDSGAAADVTGRGHDGTLVNSPTFPTGHIGLGLQCVSASSQYVEVADHADFTLGTLWTVMCWVKPTTLPAAACELVCKKNQWWFSYDDTNWQHVAGRYDGSNLQVVRNGAQVNTATPGSFTMIDNTELVRMGSWDGVIEFLNGALDDVRVFNEYLTDAQITAQMATSPTYITKTFSVNY